MIKKNFRILFHLRPLLLNTNFPQSDITHCNQKATFNILSIKHSTDNNKYTKRIEKLGVSLPTELSIPNVQ